MDSISDYEQYLQGFPKGYVSRKRIHGKDYFYLQWKEGGKVKSKYIKRKELDRLLADLGARDMLIEEIARKKAALSPLAKVGERALSLTGDLMMGERKVAQFENGKVTYIDQERVPYLVRRTKDVRVWLESRVLDLSRMNARRLVEFLGLKGKDKIEIALANRGISLTDNYWFRVKGSKTKYASLALTDDSLFSLALNGVAPAPIGISPINAELTSLGSFEKGWNLMKDGWWLYKRGKKEELFSEWFCCELAKALSIPTVTYIIDGDVIRSKNFADNVNLELMSSVAGANDDYDHVFECLEPFGERIQEDYLRLMWFDCLVYNMDRHTENMGFLRDKESGELISFAPNFDNNMALLAARGGTLPASRRNDKFLDGFITFLENNEKALNIYKRMRLPDVEEELIRSISEKSPIAVDSNSIVDFLLSGAVLLKNLRN